jgi:hypothetical protein
LNQIKQSGGKSVLPVNGPRGTPQLPFVEFFYFGRAVVCILSAFFATCFAAPIIR